MAHDRSLAEHKKRVLGQIRTYTNCVCADDNNCRILDQTGFDHSHWLPGLVSAGFGRTESAERAELGAALFALRSSPRAETVSAGGINL